MRIKIEHLSPPDHKDKTVWSSHTRVYDQDSGEQIRAIQKIDITYSASDWLPRARLELINFEAELDNVEVEGINVVAYGPHFLRLEDMDREQMIEALKFEGVQRFKQSMKLRALKKEIKDFKESLES